MVVQSQNAALKASERSSRIRPRASGFGSGGIDADDGAKTVQQAVDGVAGAPAQGIRAKLQSAVARASAVNNKALTTGTQAKRIQSTGRRLRSTVPARPMCRLL